jgi:hypothetical protein
MFDKPINSLQHSLYHPLDAGKPPEVTEIAHILTADTQFDRRHEQ